MPVAIIEYSQHIDSATNARNGSLKLTEVELFFLSSHMSKDSSRDWAVVYLGVGNGERFRFLRDEFFPHLTVVAFDPLDKFYTGSRSWVWNCAQRWNQDTEGQPRQLNQVELNQMKSTRAVAGCDFSAFFCLAFSSRHDGFQSFVHSVGL